MARQARGSASEHRKGGDIVNVLTGETIASVKDIMVDCLADIFKRAAAAALAADPGPGLENDGGTCNMDTPAFRIDRWRAEKIQEAARRAGVEVSEFTWFGGKRWWWLLVPMHGQANRRSRMMEAAQRVLNDVTGIPGWHSCGYMAMD